MKDIRRTAHRESQSRLMPVIAALAVLHIDHRSAQHVTRRGGVDGFF
jgi:hypothetical protein